jgi:hypothetical protein
LVYQPGTGEFSVNLTVGNYAFEWFDPTKGSVASTGSIKAAGGNQTFAPPFSGPAVLYLKVASATLVLGKQPAGMANTPPPGFVALFNGQDFTGWKVPVGDNGHWKIVDGAIDCDARSEARSDKDLWTEQKFRDFVLLVDWRIKTDKGYANKVPVILPDGSHKLGDDGKELTVEIEDLDSGVFVRGDDRCQVNIWMWPIGSGEVYTYRRDKKQPPEVRAAVTPRKRMDKPRGEWNTFEITVKGDRLWVKLNGEEVITNAQLPGMPPEGPIALQHHGSWDAKNERWTGPPSLVQFRNLYVKELK